MDKDDALKNLAESFEIMRQMVLSPDADRDTLASIEKFNKRLKILTKRQTVSALYKFGSVQFFKKVQPKVKSIIRRAEKKKIGVQPTAVQRRKTSNGSRQRIMGGSSLKVPLNNIPEPHHGKQKRKHKLGDNIADNVNSAKKHAVSMKTLSRPTSKKNKNK